MIRIACLILFLSPIIAFAQCGMGIPGAGNPGCIPPDVLNQQNNTSQQQSEAIIIHRKWADRWGAIIYDKVNPVIGVSQGLPSKKKAIAEAIADCKKKGGGGCYDPFIYHNQCAALVAIDGGGGYFASAPKEDQATDEALKMCKDGQYCVPFYSGCSLPEIVIVR